MHTLKAGFHGISLLVDLNWDRLLFVGMIGLALGAGAFFGTL